MKIGFNLLLWTTHLTDELFPLLKKLKKTGYDGVEVPVISGDVQHYQNLSEVLDDIGLKRTAVSVIPDKERNPISPLKSYRQGAEDYLKWVLECTHALGARQLCGPLYQPLGEFTGQGPTQEEKGWASEVHRKAAETAQMEDILITIEYLNRFECHFLNTLGDAAAHVKRVDHPNFMAMYDSFHANIEEKDPIGCIYQYPDVIGHVHISENDRGTPGKGHFPWNKALKALRSTGYDSWLTIEAFGRGLPELAVATRVWRDFFVSEEEVYTEGIHYIRQNWEVAKEEVAV